jgi:hypothetical protein
MGQPFGIGDPGRGVAIRCLIQFDRRRRCVRCCRDRLDAFEDALRFTALRKVSSIRDCQPAPVALK